MSVLPTPICSHLIRSAWLDDRILARQVVNSFAHKMPPRGRSYHPGCLCISQLVILTKYFPSLPSSSNAVKRGSISMLGFTSIWSIFPTERLDVSAQRAGGHIRIDIGTLASGVLLDPQTSPVGGRSLHPLRCLEGETMGVGGTGPRRIAQTCAGSLLPTSTQRLESCARHSPDLASRSPLDNPILVSRDETAL